MMIVMMVVLVFVTVFVMMVVLVFVTVFVMMAVCLWWLVTGGWCLMVVVRMFMRRIP